MTPCPDCGGRVKIRGTYVEKGSGNSLVVRACPSCRTEWVHAKRTGKWYKQCQVSAAQPPAEGGEQRTLPDSRAHRLGRLIAVFDVASDQAGLKTSYIERHVKNPKFVSYNWKLECETNAISSLESVEDRQKLDALIQTHLGDREDMRSEKDLSADELQTLRAEYRRYKKALESKFNTQIPTW